MDAKDDDISEFSALFLSVAAANPHAATRIAATLFKTALEADKCDALFALAEAAQDNLGGILKDEV